MPDSNYVIICLLCVEIISERLYFLSPTWSFDYFHDHN